MPSLAYLITRYGARLLAYNPLTLNAMSEWYPCPKCGVTHENNCECPPPPLASSEEACGTACCRPGLQMEHGVTLIERTQPDGVTKYWIATQQIGALFGSEVEGECKGIGATPEAALAALKKDISNLYESLWA